MTEIIPDKSYWLLGILEYASENTEEGGVKGSLKMEKLNVLVRQKMIKMGHEEDNWELMMKPFGPADPGGLSRMLQKYHLLDIAELEKIRDETIIYKITQKGHKALLFLLSILYKGKFPPQTGHTNTDNVSFTTSVNLRS